MFSNKKNKFAKVVPQNYFYTRLKKKKQRLMLTVVYIFFGLILFLGISYILLFTKYLDIKNVSFVGMDTIKQKEINSSYLNYVSGKYYFLNKNNILVLSSSDLTDFLKEDFRRIEDVKIDKKLPSSLEISVYEYKPVGTVCKNIKTTAQNCLYFDKNGVIFDTAPFIIGEMFLFIHDADLSVASFPYPKYSKENIKFISDFKDALTKESGIFVEYFNFKEEFLDIEVGVKLGFKIFLSHDQPAREQAHAVAEVLKNEIGEGVAKLDYIDLRIKNRAYYSFKNKENKTNNIQKEGGE